MDSLFSLQRKNFAINGKTILHDITLDIRPGEKIALLGPSGAGKTSLLRLLYPQQAHQCALQPQHGGLVELLSVYQNIFMGALGRVSTPAALWNLLRPLSVHRQAIQQLCEQLGLEDKLWCSLDQLSGGQRQRVALGRALYRHKQVFLGDEPVSAVDPLQAQLLLELILEQHNTAIISLHNRHLALNYFDRIIVMSCGRIITDQPTILLTQTDLDNFYQDSDEDAVIPVNL